MELHVPETVHGDPPPEWLLECLQAPITRAPRGQQFGLPSTLDYSASTGIVSESGVFWTSLPTDHAGVFAKLHLRAQTSQTFRRTSWKCKDAAAAASWAGERLNHIVTCSMSQFAADVKDLQKRFEDTSTCAERRKLREPESIKALRRQLSQATSAQQRNRLQRLIWEGRKHWLRVLRELRAAKQFEQGRPAWKAKKLHKIASMQEPDGETTYSHQRWAELVESTFTQIWKCGDPHLSTLTNDWLSKHNSRGLLASQAEVGQALNMLRHTSVLDCHGICGAAVRIVHSACPAYLTSVVNRLSTDRREMESLQIQGKTKAKQKGAIAPTKIRTIIPLPILYGILDVLVAKRINEYANLFSASVPYGSWSVQNGIDKY